jgi:hypothetical protein
VVGQFFPRHRAYWWGPVAFVAYSGVGRFCRGGSDEHRSGAGTNLSVRGDELGSKLWEMRRSNTAVQPMTLGHMRRNGVHSLLIACQKCRHEVVMTANLWGDDVPAIGPRMICSKCGNIGADSRPNWQAGRTD